MGTPELFPGDFSNTSQVIGSGRADLFFLMNIDNNFIKMWEQTLFIELYLLSNWQIEWSFSRININK